MIKNCTLKDILFRFKENPLGSIKRFLYKTTIGPLKYKKGNGYDASKYWTDRFSAYGMSIKGPGDNGYSEKENIKIYRKEARAFKDLPWGKADFQNLKVLEVGCGTGFYTQILHKLGVKTYTGVDITDLLFPKLRKKFPQFSFIRKDVTTDKIVGKFDLIVIISVAEHIVEETKLSFAMDNLKKCLSKRGILMLGPIRKQTKKIFFYCQEWSLRDIKQKFPGYIFKKSVPSRKGHIYIINKYF